MERMMMDLNKEQAHTSAAPPGTYREQPPEAIASLRQRLVRKIEANGPIPFADFMAEALYHPNDGYYARRSDQLGRSGDFFTSVSIGPLFGQLLATHIAAWWQQIGAPSHWRIIELGAHDGSLAADILGELERSHPNAYQAAEYTILEPLARLTEAQAQNATLTRYREKIRNLSDPARLSPLPSFLLANEVLDALPFHVVESDGSGWQQIGVALGPNGDFQWQTLRPAGALASHLPQRPVGYRSEVRPQFPDFLHPLIPALAPGRMLWIDYGFEHADYYHPDRISGTLRTFHRHRAGQDPLSTPGAQDITAHVDFTALRRAIESHHGRIIRFENQSRFLTAIARPWLLSLEGRSDPATAKQLRQFQTLTHPGQLGSRFHLMEADFGPPPALKPET